MAKQPFLPLFFGDFLASTAEWGGEERALYLLALAHSWASESLPADLERLRRMLGYDKDTFGAAWPTVARKFVETDGRLFNARLEEHRARSVELASKRADLGRKGAAKRWQADGNSHSDDGNSHEIANGSANGPAIEKDGNSYPMSMPSIPSHPIPSDPKTPSSDISPQQKHLRSPNFDPATVSGLDRQAWAEWVEYRAKRKPAIKPASMAKAAQAMAALDAGQRAAVDHSIANGYQGLIPPKDGPNGRRNDAPRKTRYELAVERLEASTHGAVLEGDAGHDRAEVDGDLRPSTVVALDFGDRGDERRAAQDGDHPRDAIRHGLPADAA